MRVRSLLLSTVLCGGVVAAAMMAFPGRGCAETLRPQGSWAVSKVEPRQGSVPYCAMARRFGNGSVLTFARNERDEGSLAADFPRGTFEPGKSLTVVLDAGAGTQRSFETTPISERSIIIRMGEDQKFNDALEQSGQLKIDVGGKAFVFAMPDMAEGTQDLAACLGQGVEPAAGTGSKATADSPAMQAMPAPSVEKVAMNNNGASEKSSPPVSAKTARAVPEKPASAQLSASTADGPGNLQSLNEENMRLRGALERERRQYENSFQQNGENTSAASELMEKVRLLEMENIALKEKTGGVVPVAAAPAGKASEVLSREMASLKAENTRLTGEIEAQRQRVATLEKEGAEKPDKADDKKSNNARGAEIAQLQSKILRLEADNNAIRNAKIEPKVIDLSGEKSVEGNLAIVNKMKETETLLVAVRDERDRLAAEINGIKNADADSRVRISSDNWDLEKATERFNEAEREIRRLGAAVEKERAKCMVEKKDIEAMLFDPKIATKEQIARLTSLEEEIARAKKELEQSGGNKAKTEALEARIRELETKINDLNQRNASYEQQAQGIKVTEAKIRDLEGKLAATAGSTQQQTAGYEARITDLQGQLALLTQKKAGYEQEILGLKGGAGAEQQKAAAAESRVREMEAKATAATAELERTRQSLQMSEQKQSAVTAEQKTMVDALKQEVASLNGQLANMQSEKTAMALQLAQIRPAAGGDTSADVRAARSIARADTVVSRPDIEVSAIGASTGKAPEVRPVVASVIDSAPMPAITAATAGIRLMSAGDVESLLRQAAVTTDGAVQKLESSIGAGRVAYRWQTEGLFGTAEQKGMETTAQFDDFVRDYLSKTKSRCTGQFASVPVMDEAKSGSRVAAYEIACVDANGAGASAALTFYSTDGKTFTTIAHEAAPESMDVAMDARDRIVGVLQGGKTAAR